MSRAGSDTISFRSFFMGGFECSTHRNRSGKRLDLINATAHARLVSADYARLREHGIRTVREGLRWHLIEPSPGAFDFSSALPIIRAARDGGMQIIWDTCHYGWPEDLDIFHPEFIKRFARLMQAFARLLAQETDEIPIIAPVNEISFFSWACADVGIFYPYAKGQGGRLKRQLIRAAIEGADAFRSIIPQAQLAQIDPLVNVIPDPLQPELALGAEEY